MKREGVVVGGKQLWTGPPGAEENDIWAYPIPMCDPWCKFRSVVPVISNS